MITKAPFTRFLVFSLFIVSMNLYGQTVDEALKTINRASLKGQLGYLASDWMEGRESETKGAFMAGDYIASMFQVFGLEPFGDMEYLFSSGGQRGAKPETTLSYFQKFNIIKFKMSDKQALSLIHEINGGQVTRNFKQGIDYSLTGIETDTEIEAPVVFVGYGVRDESLKYNDFAKVNAKGKIILRVDGYPGFRDTSSVAYKKMKFKNLWSEKERWAIESGAVGVINLSSFPAREFGKALNLPFRYENGAIESDTQPERYYDKRAVLAIDSLQKSFPVITVSSRLQHELLSLSNIDLYRFEQEAKANPKPVSKEIVGVKLSLKSGVETELMSVRNVLGMIEGENKNEFIVVGAHYDHLGKYNGYIFNGADDNGSGTVGMMSIARAIKALGKKPKKTIIFAAWTAEEKGLLGSEYFVKFFPGIDRIALNMNFDMIGRNSVKDSIGNKCGMDYTGAFKGFQELSEKQLKDYGLNLNIKYNPSEQPTGGSDFAPFSAKGIPVIAFMAAMHPDYHKPSDEIEKIEWGKMENIVKLGFLDIYELANSDLKKFKK